MMGSAARLVSVGLGLALLLTAVAKFLGCHRSEYDLPGTLYYVIAAIEVLLGLLLLLDWRRRLLLAVVVALASAGIGVHYWVTLAGMSCGCLGSWQLLPRQEFVMLGAGGCLALWARWHTPVVSEDLTEVSSSPNRNG